jgi:hypothetical protein
LLNDIIAIWYLCLKPHKRIKLLMWLLLFSFFILIKAL